MYSKLMHLGPAVWHVADGWPYRTVPFLELLDKVEKASYGQFTYKDILHFGTLNVINSDGDTWANISKLQAGKYLLQANRHLEMGRRLEDWLPDLPCEFHYAINTSRDDQVKAANLLEGLNRPIWGISAASYRGSEAWKTWGYVEWAHFLSMWEAEYGGTILLMGGFWDDLTSTLADQGWRDIVGKTNVGAMVEVLRNIEGYIGFSSGMGVIRTVLRKPVFMLWPDHQVELSTSWAPPAMLDEGSYVASLWRDPELVFRRAVRWAKNHVKENSHADRL